MKVQTEIVSRQFVDESTDDYCVASAHESISGELYAFQETSHISGIDRAEAAGRQRHWSASGVSVIKSGPIPLNILFR